MGWDIRYGGAYPVGSDSVGFETGFPSAPTSLPNARSRTQHHLEVGHLDNAIQLLDPVMSAAPVGSDALELGVDDGTVVRSTLSRHTTVLNE